MGAATAEVVFELVADRRFGRVRRARQQGGGRHDHAVQAIAALGGLFGNEGGLDRVQHPIGFQPLQRHDSAVPDATDRDHAGARRDAVDQNRARAALAQAATELRTIQRQIVAQHVKQRRAASNTDVEDPPVDAQAQLAWLIERVVA